MLGSLHAFKNMCFNINVNLKHLKHILFGTLFCVRFKLEICKICYINTLEVLKL